MNPEILTPSPKNNNGSNKKRTILVVIITVLAIAVIATAAILILPLFKKTPVAQQTKPVGITAGLRDNVDEQKSFDKNTTAQFGYFEVNINKVTTDYKPGGDVSPQHQGYEFLLLNITAKNTDTKAHLLSDADLGILSGQEVLSSSFLVRVEPVLKASSVAAGSAVTGNLVFEVPPNQKDLKLYYNTQIYDNTKKKLNKIEYTLAF